MANRDSDEPLVLDDESAATLVLGPPRKTGANWFFTPRPGKALDAAEVALVTRPAQANGAQGAGGDQEDDL